MRYITVLGLVGLALATEPPQKRSRVMEPVAPQTDEPFDLSFTDEEVELLGKALDDMEELDTTIADTDSPASFPASALTSRESSTVSLGAAEDPTSGYNSPISSPQSLSGWVTAASPQSGCMDKINPYPRSSLEITLECLIANQSAAQTFSRIQQLRPQDLITAEAVNKARLRMAHNAVRPVWFHEALLEVPSDIPFDSEIVDAEIRRMMPPNFTLLTDADRRARAIQVWAEFCIRPLRLWELHREGPAPCQLKKAPVNGELSTRAALAPYIFRAYLRQLLLKLRTGAPIFF